MTIGRFGRRTRAGLLVAIAAACSASGARAGGGGGGGPVQCGDEPIGLIAGQADTYTIALRAGQSVILDLDTSFSSLDGLVGFFDTDGTTLLGENDDFNPPGPMGLRDSFLVVSVTADGTYFIRVTSAGDSDYNGGPDGYSSGYYALDIECVDTDPEREANDDPANATPISCETTLLDMFVGDKDVDFYAVFLRTGATITVDVDTNANPPTLDAQAALYDTDGTTQLVISDDDAAPGEVLTKDPYFTYSVPNTGIYYVAVGSYDDDDFNGGSDSLFGGFYDLIVEADPCELNRVSSTQKGSLLFYSKIELRWNAAGALVQDTVLSLLNDYPAEVNVQMYFVNGDEELDPVFSSGPAPVLIAEGEPGCNWVDCALLLTPDQPVYWSAATGNPLGCQPFEILDPDLGNGPGRPDPEGSTDRVLRGYVVAWAVNAQGNEINWNHLSGKADIVNYAETSAWEYNAWAFQARARENGDQLGVAGVLNLDGGEYDYGFDMLLFDFFAAGSQAFSRGGDVVTVDTDLTLHPITHDYRENSVFPDNPVTTKAHFDIWNMNERKLSNTRRCITCWDQALISNYAAPNNMLLVNLQSDKGKARIDGKQADECEENCLRELDGSLMNIEDIIDLLGDLFGEVDIVCSQNASLLGVAAKHLAWSGGAREVAGDNLVGMGTEAAQIRVDIIDPPGSLREDAYSRIGRDATKTTGGVRPSDRLQSAPSTKSGS